MPPRVVTFLLALVLMWSGVAMAEQRIALASEAPAQSQSAEHVDLHPAGVVGSLIEHQVDDQPTQPHAEHVLDLVVLLDAVPARPTAAMIAARPWPPADAMRLTPCLEGLQRPPCRAPSRFSLA